MTKNSKESESIYHIVQREWKQEKELRPNLKKYSFLKKLITELLKKTDYREKIEEMDITQFKYLHDTKTDKYHLYSEFTQTQDSKRDSPVFKRTDRIKGLDVKYRIPEEKGIAELYVTLMKAEDRGIDVKELDELTDLLKAVRHGFPKNNSRIGGRLKGLTKRTIDRYIKVFHQFEILKEKYPTKTKTELYELVATKDYDGKPYSRKTIRNIIEEKRYNLKPSR